MTPRSRLRPHRTRAIGASPIRRRTATEPWSRPGTNRPRPRGASVARGLALAIVAAIVGGVAIVLLGGIVAVTAGLVVVAAATGWGVGVALRLGAGDRIAPRRRVVVAVILALAAVLVAQLGLWQYALREGGVLPFLDYLGEVYGPLVLLEAAGAAVVAWLASR